MMSWDPKLLMLIGFLLMVLGVALPFLMVLNLLESTLFLNFFSFVASLVGLIIGFLGTMSYARKNRRRRDR